MNYQDTLDYLYNSAPLFQQVGADAYKEGLETTHLLDEHFGHPHRNFHTIHVAGTNGKGSCSHTLAAIIQRAGYRVGLYTSPHLVDFRERIRVNGEPVPEQYVIDFVERERAFFEPLHPSFFELTTAMAFHYFDDEKVDVAVIEVGMGGRLDCTNIITPDLSIITNISLDHTQFLGHTLAEIAEEKAGIIKPGVPVVIGESTPETREVFERKAQEVGAPIFFAQIPDENNIPWTGLSKEKKTVYDALLKVYTDDSFHDYKRVLDLLQEIEVEIPEEVTQWLQQTYDRLESEGKKALSKIDIYQKDPEKEGPLKKLEVEYKERPGKRPNIVFRADCLESQVQLLSEAMLKRNITKLLKEVTEHPLEYELKGLYQEKNKLTILTSLPLLLKRGYKMTVQQIREGFAQVVELTGLQGRWQQLQEKPRMICDTGHNVGGIAYIAEQLKQERYNTLRIVIGMVNDKDIRGVLALLPKEAVYYFTQASVKRAMPAEEFARMAEEAGLRGEHYPDVVTAVREAQKESLPEDLIFVGGSSFIVADLLANRDALNLH